MRYLIEEFIADTNSAKTIDEVFILYQKAVKLFGYDSVIYTFMTDHRHEQKTGRNAKRGNPDDHAKHHWVNDYQRIDPATLKVRPDADPLLWEVLSLSAPLSKQQLVITHAVEGTDKDKPGVPIHGPRGEVIGVGLASMGQAKPPADKNTLCALKLITEQFHIAYCSLASSEFCLPRKPHLTKREIEILQWLACGKTANEIASILDCTKSNIKFHVQNLYAKLDVNTKIHAVTKAIRMGLIPLEVA